MTLVEAISLIIRAIRSNNSNLKIPNIFVGILSPKAKIIANNFTRKFARFVIVGLVRGAQPFKHSSCRPNRISERLNQRRRLLVLKLQEKTLYSTSIATIRIFAIHDHLQLFIILIHVLDGDIRQIKRIIIATCFLIFPEKCIFKTIMGGLNLFFVYGKRSRIHHGRINPDAQARIVIHQNRITISNLVT